MSPAPRSVLFLLLLILCLGIGYGGTGCAGKRMREMKVPYWRGKHPVMVVAHRGFSGAAPENTLAAFRKAMEIGCDMIELDVQLSKDGKVIVLHDDTVGRTTNGRGRAVDFTLKELKDLDAGSWFGRNFSGEKIPTLEEVLLLAKDRVLVNIEIKHPEHGQYPVEELTEKAVREVRNAGMIPQVIFSSFNPAALEWIKKNEPRLWVAFLFHRPWESLPEVTGEREYEVLNLRNLYLTRDKIAALHRLGKKVNVYTVNSEEEIERFVQWGADGIITNHPDRLIKILKKK